MPASYDGSRAYPELLIHYPIAGTLFPKEISVPVFRWGDTSAADTWMVELTFPDQGPPMTFEVARQEWMPMAADWETIKQRSLEREARMTILGWQRAGTNNILSRGRTTFSTSPDEVGAPIFYREVILPFIEAVKDPGRIRWRFGSIASAQPPPVVLQGMPVCGNCHSFPKDGSLLAMDVDYANNKGSYVIAPVAKQTPLKPRDVITWDDYRREEGEQTFGLLSQISPDGQLVVSTVKDRSVFVPKPDLELSQLFFPIKGILVVYDRKTRSFRALPGADDTNYVQSNPAWSPDGKYIVFARAKAYQLRKTPLKDRVLLTPEDCEEFLKEGKPFQFEIYRVPYNDGRGGTAEPLAGASGDGLSNYFPRYSPDGKWIVFCKARNYMLLQPDSELYLIPAAGGQARRLRGNTSRMNSWHSWSPNSRWLVFSSKANGPYTQLCLTHIDACGESSPPVLLAHFTETNRAANIPEFVNLPPSAIEKIEPGFLNDHSHARAGFVAERTGDTDRAIREYHEALRLNPDNPHAHERLGYLLYNLKRDFRGGLAHCREAVRLNPGSGQAHFVLGLALFHQEDLDGAVQHLRRALQGLADATDPNYTPLTLHQQLGLALLLKEDFSASAHHLAEAARLDPANAHLEFSLATALARQGLVDEPLAHYRKAVALKPELDRLPQLHDLLSVNLARAGRSSEALASARKALAAAQAAGREDIVRQIEQRMQSLKEDR